MGRWTTAKDLKDRLQREWDRGRILAAQLAEEPFFPYRIPLRHPGAGELGNSFAEAREWQEKIISQSKDGTGHGYELEWREINHRQLGRNKIAVAALFSRPDDGLEFIGKTREAEQFLQLCAEVLKTYPELRPWLSSKPIQALAHAAVWPKLSGIITFLQANPRPAIYLRQLDVAGVDTKFIEKHKKLLSELLDIILPDAGIDQNFTGGTGFEQRYGFQAKPIQIRFRLLDPDLSISGLSDLQIPVADFAKLQLPVKQIFITENLINGLAFPYLAQSLVIFGLGYGLDRLAGINWLQDKTIYYWGDIDTHGFAMLDQIRTYFPQTISLLMDRNTVLQHQEQWGHEQSPANRELPRLNEAETQLYNDLRNNQFTKALRLEQEKISYTFLQSALKKL
ncbi:MAG: hypothetical protein KJ950_05245 [Proteobacteria bacterium]|nr:hypothetical protein [Pseudomonadota bacterium]MBU1685947.1 hypothetical protein [Pseudomonadota bacterium]